MTEPDPASAGSLLLIGGGRWARVYLSVLAGIGAGPLVVVSRHGGVTLQGALAPGTSRVDSLDEALAQGAVRAAIITNAARAHVLTAEMLLTRNIPVLVEKPVALSETDATRLTALARTRDVRLMPGHVLSQCAYLKNFVTTAKSALGEIAFVSITWRDPAGETRYGESKSHDLGLGVSEDIGPHIASILQMFTPRIACPDQYVRVIAGGLEVGQRGLNEDWGVFSIVMERGADQRERLLVLRNSNGGEAILDFSAEPGIMTIGGARSSADPDWTHRPSPLVLQVQSFLSCRTARDEELAAITEITAFVAGLAAQVRATQEMLLELDQEIDPAPRLVAMREVLAPRAVASGRLGAGDNAALDALARAALERLSREPKPDLAAVLHEFCGPV